MEHGHQGGPTILGHLVRPGWCKELSMLSFQGQWDNPLNEVDCPGLHMLVKVSKSVADPSDVKKLTVENTVPTVLWVSQEIQKVIVCIYWFRVKICVDL